MCATVPVPDGSPVGTVIGQATAYDPDGDPFVFALVAVAGSYPPFRVDSTGVITVDGNINYVATPSFTLTLSVNETWVSRDCLLSTVGTVTVNVGDLPDAPYWTAHTVNASLAEEHVSPYTASGTFVFTVQDYTPANTSAVTVAVTGVVVTQSIAGVLYTRPSAAVYFDVVSAADGTACIGGVTCTLRVSGSSPRMDYDVPGGLRAVNLTLTATGATGLTSAVSVEVDITNINERTCDELPWGLRPRVHVA